MKRPKPDLLTVFETSPSERLGVFYRRLTEPRVYRPRTKAEWQQLRGEVRDRTLAALGLSPLPDKMPLESRVTGGLDQEGYRIERVYWQTWPRVWAGGWLYLPTGEGERRPAVVCLGGAAADGLPGAEAQAWLAALARRGMPALWIQAPEVGNWAMGLTPATVVTFTGMRAFDYLASRPDVERQRLGLAALADGVESATYLLAVEDRIRAASLWGAPGEPETALVPGLLQAGDLAARCAVASPWALQWLVKAGGEVAGPTPDEVNALRSIYRLWLQPDRLNYQVLPSGATAAEMQAVSVAWLGNALQAEGAPDGAEATVEQEVADAAGLRSLLTPPEADRGAEGIFDWFSRRVVAVPPQIEGKSARRSFQDRVRQGLSDVLGGLPEPVAFATEWGPDGDASVFGSETARARRVSFRSEADVRLAAVFVPGPGEGPWPVLIAAHPEGKTAALASTTAAGLWEQGFAVLAVDVRFHGELQQDWDAECIAGGRPAPALAAADLLACIGWAHQQPDVDPNGILIWGHGVLGIPALLAAAFDERVSCTLADCCRSTYRDGDANLPVIPNILRVADVPQIASVAAPRPLWLYNVPPERVGFASRRYYDWTRRSYQSLGSPDMLNMTTGEQLPDPKSLHEWLQRRLKKARK